MTPQLPTEKDLYSLEPGDEFAIYDGRRREYTIARVARCLKSYFVDETGQKWSYLGDERPYRQWSYSRAVVLSDNIRKQIADTRDIRKCQSLLDSLRAKVVNDAGLARRVLEALRV